MSTQIRDAVEISCQILFYNLREGDMQFLTKISGVPGSGECEIVFKNGAVSNDLKCGQFFMMMQDKDASLDEVRSYAKIGPIFSPDADWDEINRIIDSFEETK